MSTTNPHLEVLRRVTEEMTESRDLARVLSAITDGLVQHANVGSSMVFLYLPDGDCPTCAQRPGGPKDPSLRALHRWAIGGDVLSTDERAHRVPLGRFLVGRSAQRRERIVVNDYPGLYRRYIADRDSVPLMEGDAGEPSGHLETVAALPLTAAAIFPLIVRDELVGVLGVWANRTFDDLEVEHLAIFARQAAAAIKTAELFEQVERTNAALASENEYLRAEVREETGFGSVVGESRALRRVLRAARQVAATDSTVLLLGETGTGKEVIARAIHDLSPRRSKPLIKVNCGAIAGSLAESELFGHERGAFTGAVQRRIGRFELADGGTLFMDEVGELSLDLQVKLLRILQEREFERLGGHQLIKVDVRLIAATNRVLTEEVASGRFRADLYYRLNVFPIHVPPLRERREDIRRLAEHFLDQLSRRLAKPFRGFSADCLAQFEAYDWPGNVRELHNVVERLSVVATGPLIDLAEPLRVGAAAPDTSAANQPLRHVERDHITRVLVAAEWKIEGPSGAARTLGMAPSTLRARMNKLGISRRR